MIAWSLERVADAVRGRLVGAGADTRGVSIDSRTLERGALFVAIRGERFDGHDFTSAALAAGAAGVLVERDTGDAPAIIVDDSARALSGLASAYRASLRGTVVGVTGSAGKTTTCRLIDAALGAALDGSASVKSFNNAIGVPLTILGARESDAYLVCEMGTSSKGEIARLAEIARPGVGVITSIGRAHLEGLGDLDGVRREKAAIGGALTLIPPGEDALREHIPSRGRIETVEPSEISVRASGTRFTLAGETYEIPLVGAHHAQNGAFAARVATELGVAPEDIRRGLARADAPSMRFETHAVGGATIVNDAYNANPESMIASLRAFAVAHARAPRKVAVLGDMLELGPHSAAAHAEIAGAVGSLGFETIVAVGPAISEALGARAALAQDALDASTVVDLIREGDAVLLKGSRGIGLERVLEAWRERCAEGANA